MMAYQEVSASLEDYLEAIFHIVAQKRVARPKDISRRLKVNSSSVTGALRSLSERGLVHYEPYDVVTLTAEGEWLAEGVVRRHQTLHDFFVRVLKVDEGEAEACACKMEHELPPTILERLIDFIEFVKNCPKWETDWVNGFGYHCESGTAHENCERCLSLTLEGLRETMATNDNGGRAVLTLQDLKPGQRGKVIKVRPAGETGRRLVEMGVTPGTMIELERVAPLGDPIDVKVKGYHLSLRKEEAANILVEPA